MYFKKIEIHGFKSFAEPVTVEFDRGITCVVGPNGSGKSNISDAIRWVLGEQSPKMLRGTKMDEVIFSGTAGRKSRGMAEVTLTIDNSDRSLDIDFQEVAITRRMYRTGESEYYINKSQCRLRDIRELIMDTGIGVDGYSIIGQGKISDVLSNKTESRREIFEEAAGIVAYRTRKAESERKLESTRANMDRVLDIIAEIDRKLPGLEEDSVKAAEYLELRERYKELEINIILKNIEKIQLAAEYIKDDLMELDIDLESAGDEKKESEDRLGACNRKNEELQELSSETQGKLLAAIDEFNALANKGELDKERVAYIDRTTDTYEEEISQSEDRIRRETENMETIKSQAKEAQRELDAMAEELEEKTRVYSEMADELAALAAKGDEYRNEIFEASSAVSSAKAEISSLDRLKDNLEERQQIVISRRDEGEGTGRDTIDTLNKLKADHRQLAEKIEEEKERQAGILKETILLKAERKELTEGAEALRIESGKLTSRAATLKEMEDNYDGYNYGVKHVMRSGIPGIHGVVADLIEVPAKYATAIETALGGSIQNVVCEDDRSAKKAIESLKKNRAGRVTFLPVGSVRGNFRRDSKLTHREGFLGFGPDIVKADDKYEQIIANLLGRVAVVDNMDNAIAISKEQTGLRLVTLDGEIISGSGAITGGKYKNKTANILDRKAEIAALEKKLQEAAAQISQKEQSLVQVGEKIAAQEAASEDLEAKIREDMYSSIELENEIKTSEAAIKDLKSDAEKLQKELKGIEEERAKSADMVRELNRRIEAEEAKKQDAERFASECLEKYNEIKERYDAAGEEITSLRVDVSSRRAGLEHTSEMISKAEDLIRQTRADIDSKRASITALKEEKNEITSGHGDVSGLLSEKERDKNNLQQYMDEINEEKSQVAKDITEATETRDRADEKLRELQEKKYQLDIKQTKNDTQLENYKNKLWEDFEVSFAQAMDMRKEDFALSPAVRESRQIRARMKELGEVNVGAIEEYKEEKKRYDFLTEQRDDIGQAMDAIIGIIADLDKTIRIRFKESFDQIVINFEEKFNELFGGGHAELRLSDENDPLSSDIDIIAQPPGKKLQNINLLSGGEKTLTAIALMFAVLEAKPTPFCILDEVESALDDANIDRFIDCLRTLHGIQFTLVTHQKATMEHADVIYGVTMPEKGVSKVLSINMGDSFEI